jgi:hypothetical protein
MRMAAHTVDDDQQQRFAARDDVDAILVFRPMTRESQLCMIDAHSSLPPPILHHPIVVGAFLAQSSRKLADVHSVPRRERRQIV